MMTTDSQNSSPTALRSFLFHCSAARYFPFSKKNRPITVWTGDLLPKCMRWKLDVTLAVKTGCFQKLGAPQGDAFFAMGAARVLADSLFFEADVDAAGRAGRFYVGGAFCGAAFACPWQHHRCDASDQEVRTGYIG